MVTDHINDTLLNGETFRECAIRFLVATLREKPLAKLTSDAEVNKELLSRYPFGKRDGSLYSAWRWAIAFHREERRKLAHFEAREYA